MSGEEMPRALVVFSGKAELAWLRLLRRGFRHCFVVVETQAGWLCLNPLAHRTALDLWPLALEFDVAGWLRDQGLIVVEARLIQPPRRQAPVSLYSCVEAVKRVLGIHAAWVVTPWQLYRYLTNAENNP
ncbi:MAG: hypothetical protein HY055_00325 [Magnetospirillum sp.]|nr:hypothetical protein [Magnetospirillum sp.]